MKKGRASYHKRLFLVLSLVVGLSTFSFKTETKEDREYPILVQKALDKKLAKYKSNILKRCYEKAAKEAEAFVDSIVAEEVKLLSADTLLFPSKPVRPELKEKIILNDSTGITPILK